MSKPVKYLLFAISTILIAILITLMSLPDSLSIRYHSETDYHYVYVSFWDFLSIGGGGNYFPYLSLIMSFAYLIIVVINIFKNMKNSDITLIVISFLILAFSYLSFVWGQITVIGFFILLSALLLISLSLARLFLNKHYQKKQISA